MARRQPTVEIDESLIDAARTVARRSGVSEEELYERALRDVLARDFTALMERSGCPHNAGSVARYACRRLSSPVVVANRVQCGMATS